MSAIHESHWLNGISDFGKGVNKDNIGIWRLSFSSSTESAQGSTSVISYMLHLLENLTVI